MASFTVESSTPASGTGTVLAVGPASAPDGPAHCKIATGPGGHKRLNLDCVGLAIMDVSGFSVNDSVTVTDNGDGTVTVSK